MLLCNLHREQRATRSVHYSIPCNERPATDGHHTNSMNEVNKDRDQGPDPGADTITSDNSAPASTYNSGDTQRDAPPTPGMVDAELAANQGLDETSPKRLFAWTDSPDDVESQSPQSHSPRHTTMTSEILHLSYKYENETQSPRGPHTHTRSKAVSRQTQLTDSFSRKGSRSTTKNTPATTGGVENTIDST